MLVLACCILSGAIGGVLVTDHPILGIVLIALGVFGSLRSLSSNFLQQTHIDVIYHNQAMLLFKTGMGNVYKESYLHNLKNIGSSYEAIELLEKALTVDPSDHEIMEHLAARLSIRLSLIDWIYKGKKNKYIREISKIKRLCIKAKRKHPTIPLFYTTVGIIWDIEGKHEQARKMFEQAGSKAGDPFWRLYMATSWHLSGEHEKELAEMQKAIDSGVDHWLADFYLGRAFLSIGKYEDAVAKLKQVYIDHKEVPQIVGVLMEAFWETGRIFKSANLNIIMAFKGFNASPRFALRNFSSFIHKYSIGAVIIISRCLWKVTKYIPGIRNAHIMSLNPCEPHRTFGYTFIKRNKFVKAVYQFEKAISIVSLDGDVYSGLGASLAHLGDREGAIKNLNKAITLDPRNSAYQWNLKQVDLWVSGKRGRVIDVKRKDMLTK